MPQPQPVPQPAPAPAAPVATPPATPQPNADVQNLQKELGELKDQLGQLKPFVDDASILVSAIYTNPQLKQQVQTAINQNLNQPGVPGIPPSATPPVPGTPPPATPPVPGTPPATPPPGPQIDPQVKAMDLKMRDDIVKTVEGQLGYGNLDDAQKKELRGQVETKLNSWNTSVMSAPVSGLTKLLKDAYLVSDISKAKEQGRVEGLIESHQNAQGAFPAMGAAPAASPDTQMTEHHQTWSQKMGVNVDKVAQNLKEFSEKGKIEYKLPQPAAPAVPPAPSGAPVAPSATPPAPGTPPPATLPAQPVPAPAPQPQPQA